MRAFLKKEWMELCRTGRLLILLLIFTLFGIMNPALAKLTPWLLETLSDSLAAAGLVTTTESQKGTLIPVITKGLSRRKIVLAKALLILAIWTAMYLLCFGITYGYNAYFWDNSIANHLFLAAALTWLFGVWIIALLIFFSVVSQSGTQVLLGVGGIAMGVYILSMFPKLSTFLPVKLMDCMSLLQGANNPGDYYISIAIAGLIALLCMLLAVVFFDRKRL